MLAMIGLWHLSTLLRTVDVRFDLRFIGHAKWLRHDFIVQLLLHLLHVVGHLSTVNEPYLINIEACTH